MEKPFTLYYLVKLFDKRRHARDFLVVQVGLAGNVVGRGAPWGHVQSAGGPVFGAGPWSGLYVISPKKIGIILINGLVCVARRTSEVER